MSETERKRPKGEFDLGSTRATLLIMVVVPVILSLVLVAAAVVFGRPLDSTQASRDGPAVASVHLSDEGLQATKTNNNYADVTEPTNLSPQAPAANEGYHLAELITPPERTLVIGLFGTYSVW